MSTANAATANSFNMGAGNGLTLEEQFAKAAELYQSKRENKKFSSIENIIKKPTSINAAKEAIKFGFAIRKEGWTTENFFVVLLLSVLKDFYDFIDLGTLGPILNIFVSIVLFIVLFNTGGKIRSRLFKFFFGAIIIEFIPWLSVFPFYILSTIFAKIHMDKKDKENKNKYAEDFKKYVKA